ncbi:hypothetical protein SKAU_G00242400 [Synaphobranchus kaupii]|uniref:Uncharacterized protein n=1 Tax=Synaphobranchus kaupii TaxID=118154 RepID=A0A9Q1IUC8_SYNKA|nr:hypothetical protein SKAU_G00242400 [Synaphobranchus kaupii]
MVPQTKAENVPPSPLFAAATGGLLTTSPVNGIKNSGPFHAGLGQTRFSRFLEKGEDLEQRLRPRCCNVGWNALECEGRQTTCRDRLLLTEGRIQWAIITNSTACCLDSVAGS